MSTTAFRQVKNWASTTCDGAVLAGDGTIDVVDASYLPSAPFRAVIWNPNLYAAASLDPAAEIVEVTVKTSNALTVTRAQEGTAAAGHLTGETFEAVLTAAALSDIHTAINAVEATCATLQTGDATLTALAAFSSSGIMVASNPDTFVARSITGVANQVVVTNGDGVAGNISLGLPQSINTGATVQFSSVQAAYKASGGTSGASATVTCYVADTSGTSANKLLTLEFLDGLFIGHTLA